jgi:hypothetical protein
MTWASSVKASARRFEVVLEELEPPAVSWTPSAPALTR